MKFCRFLFIISCLYFWGCSSSVSTQAAIDSELHSQIDVFYQAVLDKDSDKVYSYLSFNFNDRFNKHSFKEYFINNYDIFLEYAEAIKDDNVSFTMSSQPEGDTCGSLLMELDENGEWKLSNIPEKVLSIEEQKENIIYFLQSNAFTTALNEYGLMHPEFNGGDQRFLRRSVKSSHIFHENIKFSGNQVVITLPKTAIIRMECASKAWRLIQCSLLH